MNPKFHSLPNSTIFIYHISSRLFRSVFQAQSAEFVPFICWPPRLAIPLVLLVNITGLWNIAMLRSPQGIDQRSDRDRLHNNTIFYILHLLVGLSHKWSVQKVVQRLWLINSTTVLSTVLMKADRPGIDPGGTKRTNSIDFHETKLATDFIRSAAVHDALMQYLQT